MNYILGSGIVGLMARHLLGPSWRVIPFFKSRIYSFKPALCDNFVVTDKRLDPIVEEFGVQSTKYGYRIGQSYLGQVTQSSSLHQQWLEKVYNYQVPPHAEHYWRTRSNLSVYGLRLNELYSTLLERYMPEIREEAAKGPVTEIGDHKIKRAGVSDYDQIVSTIPLDALLRYMGKPRHLPSRPVYYYHVQTDSLNFEGMQQLLVVDKSIPFFKVANLQEQRYLFYFLEDVPNPGLFFMTYMSRFDILDGTRLEGAIPLGPLPDLKVCTDEGIHCIGAYANWDWCLDVGSCVIRVLDFMNKKPGVISL